MEIITDKFCGADRLVIRGRIDGTNAPDLIRETEKVTLGGAGDLVLDFSAVTYLSSAGIRSLLSVCKMFQKTGGRIFLVSVPVSVSSVLQMSGISGFMNIAGDMDELRHILGAPGHSAAAEEMIAGIGFSILENKEEKGRLFFFGNPDKLPAAGFSATDCTPVEAAGIQWGAGLAALGDDYGDFENLFGETVVIGRHAFTRPTGGRTSVDYQIFAEGSEQKINFFYGFGFNGNFARIFRFDCPDDPPSLDRLAEAAASRGSTRYAGVVLMAVSSGIEWIALARSPVAGNAPGGASVFDPQHFPDWFNYSSEPCEINKTVVAAGLYDRRATSASITERRMTPAGAALHLHGAIFERGIWSNQSAMFGRELLRVTEELECHGVAHLLGSSRFRSGFIGIVDLEE